MSVFSNMYSPAVAAVGAAGKSVAHPLPHSVSHEEV